VFVEGDALVYRTSWHPDGCPAQRTPPFTEDRYTLDIGSPQDLAHIGWGWHYAEEIIPGLNVRWLGQHPSTQLYLDLPPNAYEVSITAQAFHQPRTITLSINGTILGSLTLMADHLTTLTLTAPAEIIGTGQNL